MQNQSAEIPGQSRDTACEVEAGVLYVVATPIGNLGDLSDRAQRTLSSVSVIAAEDTRNTGGLLRHFGIQTPMVALHDHNESQRCAGLIEQLANGSSIALVSDAGTPLISDPGFALVREARARGLEVRAIPGPCAAIAALSISGLPCDRFSFEGFLPAKRNARRARLREISGQSSSLILYESSHRILDCAVDLGEVLGRRPIALAREITKRFEQSVQCAADELPEWLNANSDRVRGEFALVIAPAPRAEASDEQAEKTLRILMEELSAARAAKVAASLTGLKKNHLYQLALRISADPSGSSE